MCVIERHPIVDEARAYQSAILTNQRFQNGDVLAAARILERYFSGLQGEGLAAHEFLYQGVAIGVLYIL